MSDSTESIKEKLESIQKWSYERIGRDPTEIPWIIELTRYRQRQTYLNNIPAHKIHEWARATPEMTDPVYRGQMDLIYRKFRTTAYQDPVILGGIAHHIDEISASAQALYPEATAKFRAPLLATVPITLLNGFALKGADGGHGIVLQEGLRYAPLQIASEIGRHLFVSHPTGIVVDMDPQSLFARLGDDTNWADSLLGYFVRDISEPYMFAPSERCWLGIQNGDARHAFNAIRAGFQTFVLAHEYAHCLMGHVDRIQPDFSGPVMMRAPEFIDETVELARSKYPQHEMPRDEQFMAFALSHVLEFEADKVGLKLVLQVLRERGSDHGTVHMWLIGVLAFFWYAEMLERVHRTFEMGDSWFGDDLYKIDFHVQGLLFRPTHPAPLERAGRLVRMVLQEESEDWLRQAFLLSWHWLCAFYERAWRTSSPRVAAAIISEELKVDAKWVDDIPLELTAIGVSSYRRS